MFTEWRGLCLPSGEAYIYRVKEGYVYQVERSMFTKWSGGSMFTEWRGVYVYRATRSMFTERGGGGPAGEVYV
jgi:hypothetical protein